MTSQASFRRVRGLRQVRRVGAGALLSGLALFSTACASDASSESESVTSETTVAEPETTEPVITESVTTEPVTTEPEPEAPKERDFSAVAAEIEAFVSSKALNGASLIVVDEQDGVIYSEQFGEFEEDRVSLIASSSKMISAGVLLKLQEQGLLDINTPISEYVEWAPGSGITTAQLLSNSSGLVGLLPDPLYAPYLCQYGATAELESCGETIMTTGADDADVIDPDTEFRYGGAQWQVAGAVAEAVSGKSWAQLLDEIYVQPCGVDSLGYLSLGAVATGFGYPTAFGGDPDSIDPTENPTVEGGAYVTSSDYGDLLLMHLRGGRCGENEVLSSASLDTMHADRIGPTYDGDAGVDSGYGMGWWVDRTTGRISDTGAFGTVPWLDLDDGYGAYLVIEDTTQTGQELAGQIEELVHQAVVG